MKITRLSSSNKSSNLGLNPKLDEKYCCFPLSSFKCWYGQSYSVVSVIDYIKIQQSAKAIRVFLCLQIQFRRDKMSYRVTFLFYLFNGNIGFSVSFVQ